MLEIKFTKDEGIPDPYIEIRAAHDAVLSVNEPERIRTGLYFDIPAGYEMQIRPCDELALHRGIMVVNNPETIDSNYKGEVCVTLLNTQTKPFEIKKGNRIARAVIVEKFTPISSLSVSCGGARMFHSDEVE